MLTLCARHTDDRLCRVAMPSSNNYVLSILEPICRRRLSNIFKMFVRCTGIHQQLRQLTDFSR